jgi:hypothetical protein
LLDALLSGVKQSPKKSTKRELVEAAVEGAAGMVPIAGSPMAVAFAVAMGWTYNKRMTLWLDDLAKAVDDLQQKLDAPLSFEELAEHPAFIDSVVHATRAAQATHQQQKLDALRNAVLNSTLVGAPDVDEQARFFRLIDQFTPAQLRMLAYLNDPAGWYQRHNIEQQQFMTGSRLHALQAALPEFGSQDWALLVAKDLADNSLLIANLTGMVSGGAVYDALTTPLAKRLLAFIDDPREGRESFGDERA